MRIVLDPNVVLSVLLQQHIERISALPKPKQRAVIDVIEAMLAQQGR